MHTLYIYLHCDRHGIQEFNHRVKARIQSTGLSAMAEEEAPEAEQAGLGLGLAAAELDPSGYLI